VVRRLLLVLFAALACASTASAYPWPFKPFDRQHPIRGFFGDPRTVYDNGILSGAFAGPAFISFHQGVDISAPNGTPIYAVADGHVHYLGAATMNLVTDHDVTFQYFHLVPVAGEGQVVQARTTILGYVQAPFAHVHLT
jgi:murein DD-endopeptidase MepM/ murein hydrolase activator NlpD